MSIALPRDGPQAWPKLKTEKADYCKDFHFLLLYVVKIFSKCCHLEHIDNLFSTKKDGEVFLLRLRFVIEADEAAGILTETSCHFLL